VIELTNPFESMHGVLIYSFPAIIATDVVPGVHVAVGTDSFAVLQGQMTALGREPSDQATVGDHAAQDRAATLARGGVGERLVDADFGDEGDLGGQGVGIIGWKGSSLGLRKPQER
jgi:hypothetical protein